MNVVVTGAAGHVGANLLRGLLAQGRAVRAFDSSVDLQAIGTDVEIIEGTIANRTSLCDAFDGADVVYHLAAHISLSTNEWPLLESINVIGTRNVVEACLYCGVRRLVHFSSVHALAQEPMDLPIDESRPLAESRYYSPYCRSKAAAEKEVGRGIQQGLHAIIINPTGIIGPHDYRPSYFGTVLLSLAHRKLPALIDSGCNWVDVRDVVEGALRAEERAPAGAKYLLSGHWVSIRDIAAMVEEITGVPAPRLILPLWLARSCIPFVSAFARLTGKRLRYTSVSLKALRGNRNISHLKASRDLDYHSRPFRETLIDTFRWFEETGRLNRPLMSPLVKTLP